MFVRVPMSTSLCMRLRLSQQVCIFGLRWLTDDPAATYTLTPLIRGITDQAVYTCLEGWLLLQANCTQRRHSSLWHMGRGLFLGASVYILIYVCTRYMYVPLKEWVDENNIHGIFLKTLYSLSMTWNLLVLELRRISHTAVHFMPFTVS